MCAAEVRRVFISSTTRDLAQYREMATTVLHDLSEHYTGRFTVVPVTMSNQPQATDPTTPLEQSRTWVRDDCDWIVLIVAWNYGYVPEGETRSVTENEYWVAIQEKKPSFVYMPGEATDPPQLQYRALGKAVEKTNLVDWRGTPDAPDRPEGLAKFKKYLRQQRVATLFSDIQDFRSKLARDVGGQITNELFKSLGPAIVLLGLQPPLKACIREVKLLAQLKRMHDKLHRMRQFGIRVWREEVVPKWSDGDEPDRQVERRYSRTKTSTLEIRGQLTGLAETLPFEVKTELSLDDLLGHELPELPDCDKLTFVDSIVTFASYVQTLFTSCDSQMNASAERLRRDYDRLSDMTRDALDRHQVAASNAQALRAELQKSIQIQERLREVLSNHNAWQAAHDEFERIDDGIEDEPPGEDETTRERRLARFKRSISRLLATKGSGVRALLAAATDMVTKDSHNRLGEWGKTILELGKFLDEFIQVPDVEHYRAMRTTFDDLFFKVDLETLAVVLSAEDRVRAIEAGLQGEDVNAVNGGV